MSKKIRKVDVNSVIIEYQEGDTEQITFQEVLNLIDGKSYGIKDKTISCEIMDSNIDNCMVGIIKTTQTKEVPPIMNKKSRSSRKIDLNSDEGLGFGNIFLYDYNLNILIYEINKNGCYHNELKVFIHNILVIEKKNPINIDFPIVMKKESVDNSLREMKRIIHLKTKILTPTKLRQELEENVGSIYEEIKNCLNLNNLSGASTMTLEYRAGDKRIAPNGLKLSFINKMVQCVKDLLNSGYYQHIDDFLIEGYTLDSEDKETKKIIDYLENTYRESFKIKKQTIHLDLQENERREGIINVYKKIKKSLEYLYAPLV